MLRKFALFLSFVCLVLLGVLTIACGGSSKPSSACTGGPYDVTGNWDISYNNGLPSYVGVINSSGLAVFEYVGVRYSVGGIPQYVPYVMVMPSITGACSFSGAGTIYDDGPPGSVPFSITGEVNSATSISGTIQGTTGGATQTTIAPISRLNGSVVTLPSSMSGTIQGTAIDDLTLTLSSSGGSNNSMTVSGLDTSNCAVSGTLNQEGSSNAFDVSIAISGSGCPLTGIKGLGFESNGDVFNVNSGAAGVYMYVISSSSDEILEIYQSSVR